MRQRITFFHRPQSAVDPALLRLTTNRLAGPSVEAAREDRVTLGLDELPAELAQLLGDGVHELHVHWVGASVVEPVSPLLARLPPGLHVFYTPQNAAGPTTLNICPLLQQVFGQSLDCQTVDTSFIALGGDRFSSSAAFQYYAPLDSLSGFANYAASTLCSPSSSGGVPASCGLRVDQLDSASGLDLSYDTISHTLKVATVWPLQDRPLDVAAVPGGRTEVGILAADSPPNLGPYDLGMAGHVAVLGQDRKPSPVLFAFPSRHREDEGASFSASFLEPTGLHPTLQLRIATGPPPRSDGSIDVDNDGEEAPSSCKLHAYLTLPRQIFADKYQLGNPLFLASKNLTALRHLTQPVDLEAPDYAVPVWGSAALLELAPPPGGQKQKDVWTAEVPLHLRYLQPAVGGYQDADVPYPVVFWACAAEEGTKFSTNPFDQANLGYDGLFGPRTEFWHVAAHPREAPASHASSSNSLINTIRVPVLDASKAKWIGPGTSVAILLGFGWVLWKLLGVYLQAGYGRLPTPTDTAAEEKKSQ